VVGFGNAFLSQYAVIAEVGNVPRARVSFEAFNVNSTFGYKNLPLPSINVEKQCLADNKFSLPDTYENFVYPKLKGLDDIEYKNLIGGIKPTDIKIYLQNSAAFPKLFDSADSFIKGAANIQGFSINVPIGTTKINRMGSVLGFTRSLNFPAKIEIEVSAIVADIKESASVTKALECDNGTFDVVLDLLDCRSLHYCEGALENTVSSMRFVVKNVEEVSESFNSNIGDSKVVNLKFSATVAGTDDLNNGLFIYAKSFMPDRPQILAWGNPL